MVLDSVTRSRISCKGLFEPTRGEPTTFVLRDLICHKENVVTVSGCCKPKISLRASYKMNNISSVNIVLCRLLHVHNHGKVGIILYSYRMTSRVLNSVQYHIHQCTLEAFEQFRALYMHNLDDEHPTRPGTRPYRLYTLMLRSQLARAPSGL